jgi:hypothetical protein
MKIQTETDFVGVAADALEKAKDEVAVAERRRDAYQRIYSRAIELFDAKRQNPTADEVMQSFNEDERDALLEAAGA